MQGQLNALWRQSTQSLIFFSSVFLIIYAKNQHNLTWLSSITSLSGLLFTQQTSKIEAKTLWFSCRFNWILNWHRFGDWNGQIFLTLPEKQKRGFTVLSNFVYWQQHFSTLPPGLDNCMCVLTISAYQKNYSLPAAVLEAKKKGAAAS